MPFQQQNSLRYYTFNTLTPRPLTHALFTRQGGMSKGKFTSLNLSRALGDQESALRANEELIFEAINRPIESAADSLLEHATQVIYVKTPKATRNGDQQSADILITDKAEITLFMRYADCLPLLFYDPRQHTIALAHAGWRGTVKEVAAKAVEAMAIQFGSHPEDLIVAMGPGICAAHYQVGAEVTEAVHTAFGEYSKLMLMENEGHQHFDLAAANRFVLEEAGVKNIEDSAICTLENTSDWFSHRGEAGNTGRFAVLMALNLQ